MTKRTADSTEAAAPPLPSPKERRRLREARGLSEERFAKALGVTKTTIRSWETGRTTPRGRKREAYAKLLATGATRDGEEAKDAVQAEDAVDVVQAQEAEWAAAPDVSPAAPAPEAPGSRGTSPAARPAREAGETPEAREAPEAPRTPPALRPPVAPPPPPPVTPPAKAPTPAKAPSTSDSADGAPAAPAFLTAEQAFDDLYARTAPGLVRQTYLLTGRRLLSQEAVERAFHLAWQRWPEVAVDRDPASWVRMVAYEHAMSPWHRLRRVHRRPDPDDPAAPATRTAGPSTPPAPRRTTLREALLGLPPSYRRTLLLYDGLGIDLPETAAETEASTPAAANRLLNARAAVAERLPELAEPQALQAELGDLVAHVAAPKIASARSVRAGSEHRAELWTRAAIGLTALILGAAAITMAVTEDHYEPPQSPGETVGGVPPRGGPEPYTKADYRLRGQLRSHLDTGPERLLPLAR
ncbi:helix-turn-helix domain-containing protein [Streptomyces sp. NBC_01619]|uniref:helix-turn-helix domain-containing protein n=1 Tax=Streptomyces sp. NBC_01619 TaxID=2975901 RepID=UPI00224E3D48|nr:helix-turn-helix domain-containing protein [Streptomyces sp. NBC_01619]MCX4512748.1 helix-turn-helix domain-containing protein [Streptomyces sp. NBC_01619]